MKIHSTIGVYASGNRKYNGVAAEHLESHIEYNLQARPGRAFFVDGKCLNNGYLTLDEVKAVEEELKENPHIPTEITTPYQ